MKTVMQTYKLWQHELGLLWRSPATLYILLLAWGLIYGLTFFWGQFLINNRADFNVFFSYHPWVYLFLAPSIAMFAWPEEIRNGNIGQLMRFPIGAGRLFVVKLAAQTTVLFAYLLGSVPFLATVLWLGTPDINLYFSGLLGSFCIGLIALAAANMAALFTARPLIAWAIGVAAAGGALFGLTALKLPALTYYRLAVEGYLSGIGFGLTVLLIVLLSAIGTARLALRLRRRATCGAITAAFSIMLLLAGIVTQTWQQQWGKDVSQQQQHTLHQASIDYIKTIQAPITLTLYAPQNLTQMPPFWRQHIRQVQAKITHLTDKNTNLTLNIRDAAANAALEQEAIQNGLIPLANQAGRPVLFGLTVTHNNKTAIVPQFHPAQSAQAEFAIMSALIDVQQTKTPKIGLMTELNLGRDNAKRPQFLQALVNKYNVQRISAYEPVIPPGTDLLIVFQTPTMSIESMYALDQYLVAGGRAIILLDPFFRTAPSADFLAPDRNADAIALDHPADILRHYGIDYNYQEVAADNNLATSVDLEGVGRTRYPLWLNLGPAQLSKTHPITASLQNLLIVESGYFTPQEIKSELTFTPLIHTSELAQIALRKDLLSENPQSIASKLRGEQKQRLLAFNLTGKFPSLFTTTPPKIVEYYTDFSLDSDTPNIPPHNTHSAKTGQLVVFADMDFLSDEYAVGPKGSTTPPTNQNIALIFNTVQHLLGEDVLLPLRTKANTVRNFTRLEHLFSNVAAGFQKLEAQIGNKLLQVAANIEELDKEINDKEPTTAQQQERTALGIQQIELQRQLSTVQNGIGDVMRQTGYSIMALNFLSPPLVAWLVWLCYIWRRKIRISRTNRTKKIS